VAYLLLGFLPGFDYDGGAALSLRLMTRSVLTDRHPWTVFLIFLRLGLTAFGGPVAHLAYFREEFVLRRQWLSDRSYADLVALCQFLPGPASSQVGISLGLSRCGYAGALAAWAGFTLPSALMLMLLALGLESWGDIVPAGVLHGLKVAAVAVVAQAVWGMARQLCPDRTRLTLMAAAMCMVLLLPFAWIQVLVLALAGLFGWWRLAPALAPAPEPLPIAIGRRAGVCWLTLFFVLLLGLPLLVAGRPNHALELVDSFFRAGSLVFGGGHVVLPLLEAEVAAPGWVGPDAFLAGYGAAQAVPGPLFTFAAFLGASMQRAPSGWLGGVICLLAIFTPSFLLVAGVLPFWDRLRRNRAVQAALCAVNAAVVGLLLAALYDPVWTNAIHTPADFALAVVALLALMWWRVPPWLVVVGCALVAGLPGADAWAAFA